MAAGRHLGFCYWSNMTSLHVADCTHLPPCQMWWQYLKWRPSYWDFPFFKMAAVRHLGLAQLTYGTTLDGALTVLSVLSNFVLIWLTVSKILKIQFFLRLAWNRLTTATFWGFYGVLIPWTMFFLIETPKRHILGWIRVVWSIDRENPSTHFCCRRRQEKRKGKVSHNLGLYFTYMGSRPHWTDFYENWQGRRGPRHNHCVQFWFQYFQGFQTYRGSKSPFSHWLCWSSLQQCCRYTAQPVNVIRHQRRLWSKTICSYHISMYLPAHYI